jgi:NitT/TauT family transport system permease protein
MRIPSRRAALLVDLLLLFGLWFVGAALLDQPYLPDPLAVVRTFVAELRNGELARHGWASVQRVLLGVGIGTLSAAPLAILTAESAWLDRFVSPLLYFLYPAPKIVFLPIIIYFLGLGDPSIIFLIALIVFFQVFVIVRDATGQVPVETIDSVQSLGAGRWRLLRYVYIPISLPAVVTALKISTGTAIAVLFIAESIGNNVGLGYYIVVEQWNRFAYNKVYAGILAISLLGIALFVTFNLLERRLNRWR